MQVGNSGASAYQIAQLLRVDREKTAMQIQETNQRIEQGKNAVQRNAAPINGHPDTAPGALLDLYA